MARDDLLMTLQEFAKLGGQARAAKLTPERRRQIARKAGLAKARKWRAENKSK